MKVFKCCSGNPYDEGTERLIVRAGLKKPLMVAAEIPMMRELKEYKRLKYTL